ncbi:hypothetical protein [Sphingomonas sp.]|uniref:hypothetical protein n=1 Tax=Sphingomonas sp. TaxID=28214 RepID=UPI001B243592|nr:hypothetical protein [Sphingomonas sp.]MBO9713247.1 hypothetical protein [Sphingomonas sp.]
MRAVGVNAAVVNDVKMTTEANRTLHHAMLKERVSLGNDILTGRASRLQVLLLDKTSFTVGPRATSFATLGPGFRRMTKRGAGGSGSFRTGRRTETKLKPVRCMQIRAD